MKLFDLREGLSGTLDYTIIPEIKIEPFLIGDYAYSIDRLRIHRYINPPDEVELAEFEDKVASNPEGSQLLHDLLIKML